MGAQALVVLAVPGLHERVELTEEAVAARDAPVAGEHLLDRPLVTQRERVHRVALAQRVGDRRGEQARVRVSRQLLERACEFRGVVLVELVPLLAFSGLAHVARRGGGALGAVEGLPDEEVGRAEHQQDYRQRNGDRYLGDEIREHGHDSA